MTLATWVRDWLNMAFDEPGAPVVADLPARQRVRFGLIEAAAPVVTDLSTRQRPALKRPSR